LLRNTKYAQQIYASLRQLARAIPAYAAPTQSAVLLQMTFRNRAFLLDLPELGQPADKFLSRVFADTTLLKVGFGFHNDLTSLKQTYPSFECFDKAHDAQFLDLQSAFGRVRDRCF
jgi:hypothetical protein